MRALADLGCGPGRSTLLAARAFHPLRLYCQDVSPAMARAARDRLSADGIDAREIVGDAAELSCPEPCDVILSTAALHWVDDQERLARAVVASLAPGGLFRAELGGSGNAHRALSLADRVYERDTGKQPPPLGAVFPSPEEWRARLSSLGCADIDVTLRPDPIRFSAREAFIGFVRTAVLGSHLATLDADTHDAFLDGFARAAERELALTMDFVRLEIAARAPRGR